MTNAKGAARDRIGRPEEDHALLGVQEAELTWNRAALVRPSPPCDSRAETSRSCSRWVSWAGTVKRQPAPERTAVPSGELAGIQRDCGHLALGDAQLDAPRGERPGD
jgi:hypothetical protein